MSITEAEFDAATFGTDQLEAVRQTAAVFLTMTARNGTPVRVRNRTDGSCDLPDDVTGSFLVALCDEGSGREESGLREECVRQVADAARALFSAGHRFRLSWLGWYRMNYGGSRRLFGCRFRVLEV